MICLWYQSRFRHKAGWLHTFLSFPPRPASCSQQFTPNGMLLNALTKKRSLWSSTSSIYSRIGKKCSQNIAAKHKKISCLLRESSLNRYEYFPKQLRHLYFTSFIVSLISSRAGRLYTTIECECTYESDECWMWMLCRVALRTQMMKQRINSEV